MVDLECKTCEHSSLDTDQPPCCSCTDYSNWEKKQVIKPTVKEIEEYMASLNIPMEQRFNGTKAEDFNVISKPKHYMLFSEETVVFFADNEKGIEVRDVIEQLVEKIQNSTVRRYALEESDYVQLMQYLMRFMDKNGVEDLKKARWYLDKMISSY